MTTPALEVDGLVKRYGGRAVVDGVSFSVATATVLALLGPNGAGKTTTVEVCEGFRSSDGGSVRVLGLEPRDRALRPRVGVMPQSGAAYPGLKAAEMLRLVASYAKNPLDPADLLDRLGLTDVAGTSYRRLSGGQQQRLSLAMAVVGRPELVFLDEPTAGLDPQARRATWELVEALRADGVTVVLTTHLLDEAERLADQVVVVDAGRVVTAGTVAELTSGEGLRFTAQPGLDVSDLPGAIEEAPGRYVVAGAVTPQLYADVTAWAARRGVLVQDLRSRSLEDVFLELTGRELRA
ncbi:MAG: ABC transporter ATP-binding protein [Actinobacteria bacterium]|nr:ABC transporter ATP-binding protein [Actinomycetota bacterium]MCA1721225.1 ABC transporter ATP-binding protein [Actinomycetota bacterium]